MSGADACCETGADTETVAAGSADDGAWCSVHSASVQLPPCVGWPLLSFSEAHTLQVLLLVAAAAASLWWCGVSRWPLPLALGQQAPVVVASEPLLLAPEAERTCRWCSCCRLRCCGWCTDVSESDTCDEVEAPVSLGVAMAL